MFCAAGAMKLKELNMVCKKGLKDLLRIPLTIPRIATPVATIGKTDLNIPF